MLLLTHTDSHRHGMTPSRDDILPPPATVVLAQSAPDHAPHLPSSIEYIPCVALSPEKPRPSLNGEEKSEDGEIRDEIDAFINLCAKSSSKRKAPDARFKGLRGGETGESRSPLTRVDLSTRDDSQSASDKNLFSWRREKEELVEPLWTDQRAEGR